MVHLLEIHCMHDYQSIYGRLNLDCTFVPTPSVSHRPRSQEARRHVLRWLPDVPLLTGGLHFQTGAPRAPPGHEPAAQPLLHLLLAQHLPAGGPAARTQQPGGIHPVRAPLFILSTQHSLIKR